MQTLKRTVGVPAGVAITVGAVLGTGVLVLPALTADQAGPAALVAWALMGLMSLVFAVTFARLAVAVPDAGGIAAYVRTAFGRPLGFASGNLLIATVPLGGPVAAMIGALYAVELFALPAAVAPLIAAVLLFASLALNYRGITLSARTQMIAIFSIGALILVALVAASPHVDLARLAPFAPHGWAAVGVDFVLLFWAFVGWEMTVHLVEEFTDPERDMVRVMAWSVLVVELVYLALAWVTVGTGAYLGRGHTVALAVLMGVGLGRLGFDLAGVLAVLLSFATTHAYITGFSRLVYAQARRGEMPAYLAALHPRFSTPAAVLLSLGGSFAVFLALIVLWHLSLETLILIPSSVFVLLYVGAMAAALRLLRRSVDRVLAAVGCLVALSALFFTGFAILYPAVVVVVSLGLYRTVAKAQPEGGL